MQKVPLWFPLALAGFFTLFNSALLPEVKLFSLVPLLVFFYNRFSFAKALWISALCGLGIDLLSSEFRLGLHALEYSLVTFALYHQKKHFFEEKPLAFSLFTILISVVATIVELCLIAVFDKPLPLSEKLLVTDLVILPLIDALYAFVCFSLPIRFYLHVKKVGWSTLLGKAVKEVQEKESTEL